MMMVQCILSEAALN